MRLQAMFATVGCAAFFLAGAARAELGSAATIAADGARLGAQVVVTDRGTFTRHDLTRPNAGMVHEFVNGGGQVFAVTWHGPGKPDLRLLLGPAFAALQAQPAGTVHALRRPAQVNAADLKIQSSGHMGWFNGVAFVPSLAPAGFDVSELAPKS